MIAAIIIISLAFAWLGHETDWLRIRLLVGLAIQSGACSPWRMSDSMVTDEMRRDLIKEWNNNKGLTKLDLARLESQCISPLFGWGYSYQFRNFKPEYKIELLGEHHHYTMRTEDMKVMRDALRVYRNPYLKVRV